MKYRYKIKDLKLFGYHGVYNNEKKDGQFFLINISYNVHYNRKLVDNVKNVIDYVSICNDVALIFNDRCDLIEILILKIKDSLEKKYKNTTFEIEITKMMSQKNKNKFKSIKVKNI